MTTLDEVMLMKSQGMGEEEIVSSLQQRGTPPKEIRDSLNQANVKNVVSDAGMPPIPSPEGESYATESSQERSPEEYYSPGAGGGGGGEYAPPQEGGYYQGGEAAEGGYEAGFDANTIIEISEQVFREKTKDMKKQLNELGEFKSLSEMKLDNMGDRLKRIENTIDKLQISILEKIGSYGSNLESIKKEMGMMQDSFGKVVNQAVKGVRTVPKKEIKK